MRQLKITQNSWPVDGSFTISRSSLTFINVVTVEITEGKATGRGECRPYARYEETPQSVTAQIEALRDKIESGITLGGLQRVMEPGAARNAVDCALWDLAAKKTGRPVWEQLGIPAPKPRTTAFTLSMDTPENVAKAAKAASGYPLLKLKIGDVGGLQVCQAVIAARPDAKLIVDANEALNPEDILQFCSALKGGNVVLIEQPLPHAIMDQLHGKTEWTPPLCADESLHTRADLDALWNAGYRAVNVKLDKTGGLTEAVKLMTEARSRGFTVMAGCMVGSSLAMAPMVILESFADYIDLDGPLLLAEDVKPGLKYEGETIYPPSRELWG